MAKNKKQKTNKLEIVKIWASKHIFPIPAAIQSKTGLNLPKVRIELLIVLLGTFVFLSWNSIFKMALVENSNAFFSYVVSQLTSQKNYWYLWLGFLVIAVVLLFRKSYFIKSKAKKTRKSQILRALKIFVVCVLTILILTTVSVGVSFASAYVAGVVHTNILLNSINKGHIGEVVWGKDKVQERLESTDGAPFIVESTKESLDKDIANIYISKSGLSQYYQKQVIAKIPNSVLIKTSIPKDSFVMVKNYLFVNEIKQDEIQQISPVLGYKLVKSGFGSRYIKSFPEITVLGRQDYLKFREEQINKRVKAIEEVLADVKKELGVANSNLSAAKSRVASYTSALSYADYARQETYEYCVELGSYYSYYTPSYCRTYVDSYWNSQVNSYQQQLKSAQASLATWQRQVSYWADINQYISNVKSIVEGQKDTTPYELGVFHDDNKIEIALDETNSQSIYPYTETLVHEYMHYTSYVSKERTLPLFFEEGLTEYYARKVIKDSLGKESNVGYPVLVKLIERMHEKIDAKKFEEIYFNKDKKALEAILEEAYGKEFYKNNKLNFEILPLISGEEQVKTANEIIEKIGGDKLNIEDFK